MPTCSSALVTGKQAHYRLNPVASFASVGRLTRFLTILIIASVAAADITACGTSTHRPVPVNAVAVVGNTAITRATLNHWMSSIAGGDFYEHFERRAPRGLAAEPPDYPRCLLAARSLVAGDSPRRSVSTNQLAAKCRALYQAVKDQALSFLISVQWRVQEASEQGISISDAEVRKYFQQVSAQSFPNSGEFATYLADREWVPSDELYQLKRNLLTTRLHKAAGHAKGAQAQERAYIKLVTSNLRKRTVETSCRPGYVVPHCRQYRDTTPLPAPLPIMEELTDTY